MSWIQKGSNILSEFAGDNFGNSISINNNGNIVAIGARLNDGTTGNASDNRGSVRVYEWNGSNWIQLGSDIDGEFADDRSGWSVAINGVGDILAVGATQNDGTTGVNGNNRGHVRIYQWDGSNWIQLGSDIDGEASGDNSGFSISLNNSGNRLAIGAPNNDGTSGNTSDNRGHVRVYEWNGSSWIQLGSDIDGEFGTSSFPFGDNSGISINLNSSGDRLVIGAPNNDGGNANTDNRGSVRVYEWNGSSWIQLGSDIDGESAGDNSGFSVAMNDVGDIVVIGARLNDATTGNNGDNRGHVRVFQWNGTSWTQLGSDIDGDASGDNSGYSVSINGLGNIIAIGAINNDGNTEISTDNRGQVKVFEWNYDSNSWVQLGTSLLGFTSGNQFGFNVSLNNSGDTLAVGAPFFNSNSGSSYIYQWYNQPQQEIPCLTADNTVLTTNGYINVDKLNVGDIVITNNNKHSIIKKITIRKVKPNNNTYPYIITKDSIDTNYPPNNCYLSSGHLIYYKDKWIHPKISGLFKRDMRSNITYYHIQLENYKTDHLVINGGLVVESFSNGDRIEYRNRMNNLYF